MAVSKIHVGCCSTDSVTISLDSLPKVWRRQLNTSPVREREKKKEDKWAGKKGKQWASKAEQ